MFKKLTTEDFVKRAKTIYGDKYDYSKTVYVNMHTRVCIVCPIHGEFWMFPNNHLRGNGCKECSKIAYFEKRAFSLVELINKFREIHGDKYIYTELEYKGVDIPVKIICPKHGEFWQRPSKHLKGGGCWKCSIESKRKPFSEFEKEARIIHGDKYIYNESDYVDTKTKIRITCSKHGEFWQEPQKHLSGQGCKKCKESKLEGKVRVALTNANINYIYDKQILGAKYKPDFYVPNLNLVIECQGLQHFKEIPHFKNDIRKNQKNDINKFEIYKENGIQTIYFLEKQHYNFVDFENSSIYNKDNVFTDIKDLMSFISQLVSS